MSDHDVRDDAVLSVAQELSDGLVTRAVLLFEVIWPNGRRGFGAHRTDGFESWEAAAVCRAGQRFYDTVADAMFSPFGPSDGDD